MAWTTTSGVCSRRLVLATLGLCWQRGSLILDPRLLLLPMRWRSGMLGRWLVVVLASLLLAGCLLKNVHDGMALLDGSDDLSLKQQPLQEKQQVEFNWLRLPQHVPVDLTMMNHITDDDDGHKHETASSSTSWRHHVISRKKKKKRKKKEEEEENDNDGNSHDLLEDESAHPQGMLCDSRRAVSIGAVATTDIVAANVFRSFNFTEDRRGPASIWFYKDPFFERRFQETQREIVVDRPTLKVIIMMWSHLDPGWLRTYDDYQNDVNKIYSGFVKRVETYSNISFTTAEVSFFSRFFERCSEEQKEYVRKLVRDGRLEIAAGGWVMTDEAAVSLYGMVDQFVQGHSWLDEHLDVAPKSGWSIDPFGHGSAVPYLLSAAGLKQTVIQRIHYQWKDYFARNQIQDFAWRQWWDPLGEFDCLTHNMPYHSYSISGTCGPFHGVCDYFDFRSVGQITPYSLKHTPITAANVRNQSELLLSMYRRTASLLQHNVLLQPLGDDFRYDYNVEFDQQYRNYKAIAEYLNTHRDKYRVEVQFGTLSDYFSSLRERQTRFPSLQGDFFPLAHEPGNYWTGYFSSRPFWKGAVRDLESELRAAELLFTYAYLLSSLPSQHNQHDEDVNKRMMNVTQLEAADKGNKDKQILTLVYSLLSTARAELAVFQHHDGITGTSRAAVMADYGRRLRRGIADARRAQAWGVSLILLDNDRVSSNGVGVTNKEPRFVPMKLVPLSWDKSSPIRCLNVVNASSSSNNNNSNKKTERKAMDMVVVVAFNPLAEARTAIVKLCVTTSHLAVLDQDGKPLDFQVNPLSGGVQDGEYIISRAWFEVEVLVAIGPLGFAFLRVASLSSSFGSHHPKHNKVVLVRSHLRLRSLTSTTTTTMDINTSNTMKNASSPSISVAGHKNHDDDDDGFVEGPRLVADDQQEQQLSFRISNSRWQLECHSASGLPVRLQDRRSGVWHPLSVQLRAYDPVAGMSGAYSSMFRGQSRDMLAGIRPHSVITEGQLVSTVRTFYNDFANLTFSLLKEPASLSEALQVQLTLHMRGHPLNAHQFRVMAKEVFLRIKTGLRDVGGAFYTDSSGLHMTKRFIIDDLHAAANYYPMTSMFYIQETTSINKEDKKEEGKQKRRRVTVVSGQSHGVTASAAPGVMDVMLDRTAHVDDHKGLGEGVEDPKRTAFKFALLLEEEEHHHHHPSAMADAAASGQSHQDYKDDAPFHPQDAQQQQQHEEELLPSAIAVAVARHLAHPPVLFLLSSTSDNVSASVAINNDDKKISAILAGKSPIAHSSMLVKSLPCNMHLLNMRFNWRRQKHRQGTSATTKTTGISSMDNIIDPQDHVIKMGKKEVLVTLHHQGVNRGFQCSLSSSLCSQAASVATSDRVSLMLNSKAFGGLQVVRTSLTGLHDFPSSKQGEEEKDTKTIKKKPTTAVPSPSVDADKRKQLPMNEQPNNFNDDAVNVDDSGQWRVHCRVMQLCSFKFLVSPVAAAATLPIT